MRSQLHAVSHSVIRSLPCLLALVIGAACPHVLPAAYTDVTNAAGLTHRHAAADEPASVEDEGGACAIDLDQDGWTDLIFARYGDSLIAYRNNRDGTFSDVTTTFGLQNYRDISVVAAGDLDNDGDPDLVLGPTHGSRYFLLINNGNGSFSEEAVARGADVTVSIFNHKSRSISLVDYDRDGYLDLYLPDEGIESNAENHLMSVLLRNRGAEAPAHFENVTTEAGLLQPGIGSTHLGFSSAWADFDGDGWPDLAKISDFSTSEFFWNNGNGTFTEDTQDSGTGLDDFGMGHSVADYDGDGDLDLMVTSIWDPGDGLGREEGQLGQGNRLYNYVGNRRFGERAEQAGVQKTGWAWGVSAFEHDNDGDFDMIVTNGWVTIVDGDRANLPVLPGDDRTELLVNDGSANFTDESSAQGITDSGIGRAIIVFDYDNDGDEDLLITQNRDNPILYRSNASENGNSWLRLRLAGTVSNRDGIGATVRVTTGDTTRMSYYNPTNAYFGQREPVIHFGLGTFSSPVDRVTVTWPSGIEQEFTGLAINQEHLLTEAASAALVAPTFTTQPSSGSHTKGSSVTLSVEATGNPTPVYVWHKNGEPIDGETGPTLTFENLHPFDAGSYYATAINPEGTAQSTTVNLAVTLDPTAKSVARWWNEALLDAIRADFPDPTVHSRNLYHTSAAMWDAYWAYQPNGWAQASHLFTREDPAGKTTAAQAQAISHAAYTILVHRYQNSPGTTRSQFGFRWLMENLGYDPDDNSTAGDSPAAVGNRIGAAVIAAALVDGSNEANAYADPSGYVARNEPLAIDFRGTTMAEPNFWQPLSFDVRISQNGIPRDDTTQTFLGVNWRAVTPFALNKPTPLTIQLDPGPPPYLGTATDQQFRDEAVEVIYYSSLLDPADGEIIDIGPGARLNNPLGTNAGTGRSINPATGEPYAPNLVNLADYGRILAEFWADGPDSETPPGHWNTLHNEITEHPLFERRYLGRGEELDHLAWDIQAYVALNGAMHDAAIAAWTLKRQYDLARPISMIRHLAGLGQSTNPSGPSYNAGGIPLVDNLVEVITAESSAAGQRHAHLADRIGDIAIRAWIGEPADIENDVGGVGWMLAEDWLPYQKSTFVSPAFAGFVSGHSTFSRAGAEVLTLMTGSPFFPGGMGTFHFEANEFLEFENGPSSDVTLQWATYYDAADQAGISRLYGGIHIAADDVVGRRLGSQVGFDAFRKAHALRYGALADPRLVNLSTRARTGTGASTTIAGFVTGTTGESLLRGIGPGLEPFGVSAFQPDPTIALYSAGEADPFATNQNWTNTAGVADAATRYGAFALRSVDADAALLQTLEPGAYTFSTTGTDTSVQGVVLSEVYHENLVNLSTRAAVGSGDDVVIAGFVLQGPRPVNVLVRGVGPGLNDFGVTGTLANPRITLLRQTGEGAQTVATNQGWQQDDQSSLAIGAARAAGAFPLESGSADAALLRTLDPGTYTVVLESSDNTTGVALVEVYLVP